MTNIFSSLGGIHPSSFDAGAIALAEAETRASGALRYQCPVTDAFILVTDEDTLETLSDSPQWRHRCPACGEIHLLTTAGDDIAPGEGLRARRG